MDVLKRLHQEYADSWASKITADANGDLIISDRPQWKVGSIGCDCGHAIAALKEDDRVYCLACMGELGGNYNG